MDMSSVKENFNSLLKNEAQPFFLNKFGFYRYNMPNEI